MIRLVPYDAAWPEMFEAESANLRNVLGACAIRIEHVGSTAIPGMTAKPVIDIQISVDRIDPLTRYLPALAQLDYVHQPLGDFDRVYPFFHKPSRWPTTHHIHLCVAGGEQETRHLAFRNFLRRHQAVAVEYARLKAVLANEHAGSTLESREQYSLGKSVFVESVLGRAAREE